MNILLANERFLFRFGVDRVLLILATYLKQMGHNVSLLSVKIDMKVAESNGFEYYVVPECSEYINSNEYVRDYLTENWDDIFSGDTFDLVMFAGWPFFECVGLYKSKGMKVIFNDYGAVKTDGYSGYALMVQEKLQDYRAKTFPECDWIIAISSFIAESQSIPLAKGKTFVSKVLLGADHLELKLWTDETVSSGNNFKNIQTSIESTNMNMFLAGRWEPNCYKNVEQGFIILRELKKHYSSLKMYVLASAEDMDIPEDLASNVVPMGFLTDDELIYVMSSVDLTLCVSLWEGFNLPLAESQFFGTPALVFNIGAHHEVVAHPIYLCETTDEMVVKAVLALNRELLPEEIETPCFKRFRKDFKWRTVCEQYLLIFENILAGREMEPFKPSLKNKFDIIIDTTNATKDPANSGVIRVTRRLSRELQNFVDPIFVLWENGRYVLPNDDEYRTLGSFNGPYKLRDISNRGRLPLTEYLEGSPKEHVLLITETINDINLKSIRKYARQNNIRITAVFHDAIPILHPEFCNKEVTYNHEAYMKSLSQADLVMPVSNFSANCLLDFWMANYLIPADIQTIQNCAEFAGSERETKTQELTNEVKILCVSTLEPRKNHMRLLKAFLKLIRNNPQKKYSLTLVGNRYAGNTEIPTYIESVSRKHPEIQWLGVVNDEVLKGLYTDCTFTVYPSLIEGFGMPIIESLWHAKPCICNNGGVMSELAQDGGCLTCDAMDIDAIWNAMKTLSTDKRLYGRLSSEAASRHIKRWSEYAQEFLSQFERMLRTTNIQRSQAIIPVNYTPIKQHPHWDAFLYRGCLLDNWQMADSERMSLKALLHSINPRCSIEIGTFRGGSLSLIAQYSEVVFSLDIDLQVKKDFSYMENVIFITGPSEDTLPILLEELDRSGTYPEFILIDGDHSYEGVKKDFNTLIKYKPKKPFFVLAHDSFNPDCRQGMLDAHWEDSHAKYIDLDFIPGRMIEHGGSGNGELWSGLALAYFTPDKNGSPVQIKQSSRMAFEMTKKMCCSKPSN